MTAVPHGPAGLGVEELDRPEAVLRPTGLRRPGRAAVAGGEDGPAPPHGPAGLGVEELDGTVFFNYFLCGYR